MLKFNMRLKQLLQNINLLNIVLISLITFFIAYALFPSLDMNIKYVVPTAQKSADAEEEPADQFYVPSLAEYTKISEENLFHPERKIPPEKKEEIALPKPEFVLYGTLITDGLSLAYLEDLKAPRNSPGRGKRQVALKKGDSMSGFTLKEIEAEKIVMVRGEERMIVPVNDPSHPKAREGFSAASKAAQPAKAPVQQRAPVRPQERVKAQQAPPPAVSAGQGAVVQPSFAPATSPSPPAPAAPAATERKGGGFGGLFRLNK